MAKIIMTGVDGNFGGHAAETILKKVAKENLIFTAPTEEKLQKYKEMGIECRKADFNNVEQLKEAFSGGDTLLLISMPFVGEKRRNAHKNAIDAAVAAGVGKIIYTSIVGSGNDECESYEKVDHQYTEGLIFESGMKYVILRDSQYVEAMVSAYLQSAEADGILANNMGDGRMAFVARNDCAEAAAAAAAGAGEDNLIYYIDGPEALTIAEFIEKANEVTGNQVKYQYISDEDMYAFFDSMEVPRYTDGVWGEKAKAFPFCSAGMVTFGVAIRKSQMDYCTSDFEMLTGKKPMSVKQVFEDLENHEIGDRTSTD